MPINLTPEQIQLAYDMEAVSEALAAGYVLPANPRLALPNEPKIAPNESVLTYRDRVEAWRKEENAKIAAEKDGQPPRKPNESDADYQARLDASRKSEDQTSDPFPQEPNEDALAYRDRVALWRKQESDRAARARQSAADNADVRAGVNAFGTGGFGTSKVNPPPQDKADADAAAGKKKADDDASAKSQAAPLDKRFTFSQPQTAPDRTNSAPDHTNS